jgi:photosystem II stability/assembly factor-like uncharacterized protein
MVGSRNALVAIMAGLCTGSALLLLSACESHASSQRPSGVTEPTTATALSTAVPASTPPDSGSPIPTTSACAAPPPNSGWSPGLNAAQFVSPTKGWVVGTEGILATTDGVHWSLQDRAATPGFDGVDFIDSEHGWAVGPNTLVRTTDGGAHWQQLTEPCPQLASVHFVSATTGFAVADGAPSGANSELMTTSDAGTTWQRLPSPSGLQSVCIDSSGRGWLGANGDIYGTTDRGAHWALAFEQPTDGNGTNPYVVDLQCAGQGAAWAEMLGGGAMSKQAHLGLHTDGVTWSAIFAEQFFPHPGVNVDVDAPGSYFGAFSAVSPTSAVFVDNCVACGYGQPWMQTTTDGGAHISKRGVVANLTAATGATFVTVNDGWVIGTDQTPDQGNQAGPTLLRIEHTTDAGRTWTTQYSTQ